MLVQGQCQLSQEKTISYNSARISQHLLNSSPIRQSVCTLYFRSSCPVYSVFSSPSLRWIRSRLHTAPPLLSVRTVNNTQGISVQGAQTSSPPPSPIHVKQCTLYSRDNCRGRRIYLRGFYTVCVAFQCGLLPKKHCKG